MLKNLGLLSLSLGGISLLSACSDKKITLQGVDVTGAEYARDFPLPDADGRQRKILDFSGKVVVVFFGFTQCPDVCPTTLQEMVEVKQALGADAHRFQGVFITLDPDRDTPEVLKAYTGNFDPSIVALTGSAEQLAAVAKDFKVYFKKVEGKTPGSYSIDHSAGSYMYDPAGRLRVYSRYGSGSKQLALDAKALLAEST